MRLLRVITNSFVNSEGWLQFIGDRNVHSDKNAITYKQRLNNTPNLTYWVIILKQDRTSVGIVSWMKRDYLNDYDIGFALLSQYQKKGNANEAAKTILFLLMQNTDENIALAITLPNNLSSAQLLISIGFQFEKEIIHTNEILKVYCSNSKHHR